MKLLFSLACVHLLAIQVYISGGAGTGGPPANSMAWFTACPSGWSEHTAARGRYVVGVPVAGTLSGTQGVALANTENRVAGAHTHSLVDPGHSHTFAGPHNHTYPYVTYGTGLLAGTDYSWYTMNAASTEVTPTLHIASASAGLADDGIQPSSTITTPAPYIQLMLCRKN